MALQDMGIGLVIGGALSSTFNNSFNTANKTIKGLTTNINSLSKTRIDIQSFRALSKNTILNKLELDKLAISLKKTGVDVRHLDRDSLLLNRSLVKLKQASVVDIRLTANKSAFEEQKASILGIGASLYGVTRIAQSASTVLKAQGEIKSLGISKEGIDAITTSAQELSLQYGQITAPEFIKASYDIKSGIASLSESGVKEFTKMAALTAVATKASTAEMTKLYALGYGIFRQDFKDDLDFGKQFSGAIAGAVQAFRTDGADLAAGLSNIGASAKAMGVSLEEELAIVGLSKGAFASASEAGSGYRAFLDGAGKAQKKLGLNFIDSAGKLLPMADILTLIKAKYGDLNLKESDELKTAFGSSEAIKTISALIPKIDELKSAQKALHKSMQGGMSKSDEMANNMDMGYGFEKMSNAMAYMSFTVGKALVPAVNMLATGLGVLAKSVAWLDSSVPSLIPIFSGLAIGIVGLVTVLKVATLAKLAFNFVTLTLRKSILLSTAANAYHAMSFNRIGFAALAARTKILALAVGTKIATGAQWLLNVAMNANPISKLIVGVAALATGALYLYNNFATFTDLIDVIWTKFKAFFGYALDKFKALGSAMSGVTSLLGFGGESENTNTTQKIKHVVGLASAFALSSGLAIAQPMPQPLVLPTQSQTEIMLTPVKQTQNFNIKVVVNNPTNNVDVETAIQNAMRKQNAQVPLTDKDI